MDATFIGLGNMGAAMARKLIEAGHKLTVYNRTRTRAEPLQALGAQIAPTPAEAARASGTLLTMLADDHAVEEVLFAPGRVLEALPPGGVHVSMSTISVGLSRRLAEAHQERGQHYLAAPVFGRPEAAAAAQLFIVVAGPTGQIRRCQPLFDAIGQRTFPMGEDAPVANVVKLAGNFLITTVIESLAEAVSLVRKSGLDGRTFLDFLTATLFAAPVYRTYGGLVVDGQFEPAGFRLPLGLKDNRLLLAAAEETVVPMPLATLVHDRFLAALAQGWSESDWSVIARLSFQAAGLEHPA